jgi:hypothetical protein
VRSWPRPHLDGLSLITRQLSAAVAVLALAAGLALPGSAVAQAPTGDSVTGSGTARFVSPGLEGLTVSFDVDVRSGPSGESPTGHFTLLLPFSDPSCFVVRGGTQESAPEAAMNFLNPVTGLRILIQVGTIEPGPQFIAASTATSPDDCAFRSSPPALAEVISGRIDIVDAPPLPTSSGQCRNGGWRSFPGFRNQGQCVAFVQRGPKP